MNFLTSSNSRPSTRLSKGNVVLANAQSIDPTRVKDRLDVFLDVHRRYIELHAQVEQGQTDERQQFSRVQQLDDKQDDALTDLSIALQNAGEGRINPFASFGADGPSYIAALPFAEEAAAIHTLVASIRRSKGMAKAVLDAAARVDQAALALEEALPAWELRRAYLSQLRQKRNALNTQWDSAYSALRFLAKSLVEDRDLYKTLFTPDRRLSATKSSNGGPPATPEDAARAKAAIPSVTAPVA